MSTCNTYIEKGRTILNILYQKKVYDTCRDARGARKEKINSIFVSHNIDRAAEIIQKALSFLYRQAKQTRRQFSPASSIGGFNVYDLTIIKIPTPEISNAIAVPVTMFANASCALPNA